MEKKLYRVKVVLYVMAENESAACVAATEAHFDIFECAARKAIKLDPGWDDAVPYNSSDARTCMQVISSMQQMVQKGAHPSIDARKWQPMTKTYAAVQASPG